MDALKNFAYSLVATPPSPATSGTSLVVTAGQGALFPTAPFDATIWPAGVQPLSTNAEIVRVTAVATDTFTITRAQYGTTAQSITAGYQIAQTIDANLLSQLAPLSGATFTGEVSVPDIKVTGLTGATAGTTRLVGVTAAGAPTSGTFQAGDVVADQTGTFWVCITGGTPGTWTNVVPNSLVTRSSTATAGVGEFTIFNGSTQYQVITLPLNPVNGSTYQIKNLSLNTVYINGGLNNVSVSGNVYAPSFTATTTASSPTLTSVSSTSNLYVGQEVSGTYTPAGTTIVSINSGASTITLSANATTSATGQIIKANYAVTVNAAYTFTYSGTGTGGTWYAFVTTDLAQMANVLPVTAGGTGVTTSTGSGSNVLSTSPSLTTPSFSSIVNSGTLTLPTSTDTLVGRATTDTLTNKRITKRVTSTTANASSYAINTDNVDVYHVTSQTTTPVQFTSSGTPVDGDTLRISMTGTTSIGLTWGGTFESSGGVLLPVATAGTTRLDVGFIWNSETSKWRLVAVA